MSVPNELIFVQTFYSIYYCLLNQTWLSFVFNTQITTEQIHNLNSKEIYPHLLRIWRYNNQWHRIVPQHCCGCYLWYHILNSTRCKINIVLLYSHTWISFGNVAENMRVCRSPVLGIPLFSTIVLIWGSKPISNILSASSRTRNL